MSLYPFLKAAKKIAKVEEVEAPTIKLKKVNRKESIKEEVEEEIIEAAEHQAVESSFKKRERPELEKRPEPAPVVEEDIITPEEEKQAYNRPERRKSSVSLGGKTVEIGKVEVRTSAWSVVRERLPRVNQHDFPTVLFKKSISGSMN